MIKSSFSFYATYADDWKDMKKASVTLCKHRDQRCSAQDKSGNPKLSRHPAYFIALSDSVYSYHSGLRNWNKLNTCRQRSGRLEKLRWGWGVFEYEFINFSLAWIFFFFFFTSSSLSLITFLILAAASKSWLALKSCIFKWSKCVLHPWQDKKVRSVVFNNLKSPHHARQSQRK